jgi:hypothetical protein
MSIDNICKYLDVYENRFYSYSHEDHLNRWLSQFSEKDVIITELSHIFDKYFISREVQEKFLNSVLKQDKFLGSLNGFDNSTILNIQKQGSSQKIYSSRLQELFVEIHNENIPINDFTRNTYIYIDDFCFSGAKARHDIINLLDKVGYDKNIIYVFIGVYQNGDFYNNKILREKHIKHTIWRFITLENRRGCINNSDIFCPTDDVCKEALVQNYISRFDYLPVFRSNINMSIGENEVFTSIENRKIIEKEFLLAGLEIIRQTGTAIQPLGVSAFQGLGFGSTIFSYRNTPNNCPLCLWWGNPINPGGLGTWYPLLMRKTYGAI